MSARQSVHGVPLVVRALGGVEPEGTHLERRKKLETSSQERYTSADILPFGVQAHADARWKKRWTSDRGLQVIDLKAAPAGALSTITCSYIIGAHRTTAYGVKPYGAPAALWAL